MKIPQNLTLIIGPQGCGKTWTAVRAATRDMSSATLLCTRLPGVGSLPARAHTVVLDCEGATLADVVVLARAYPHRPEFFQYFIAQCVRCFRRKHFSGDACRPEFSRYLVAGLYVSREYNGAHF